MPILAVGYADLCLGQCGEMYRVTYCARTGPLPLLPSGPGGVGGIASRRTRHMMNFNILSGRIEWCHGRFTRTGLSPFTAFAGPRSRTATLPSVTISSPDALEAL